jgi:hypothetical protein
MSLGDDDDVESYGDGSSHGENEYLDNISEYSSSDDENGSISSYSESDGASESDSDSDGASESDSDSDNDSIVIIDEFDIDDMDEDNLEQIERQDADHLYNEKEHGHYYIGLYKYMRNPKIFLMANTVSTRIFFKFEFQRIFRYLNCYSSIRIQDPKVEIMQLHILEDQTYSVVLKTHWIRLIQRHWKKAFHKRREITKAIKSPRALMHREVHGRFPYGLNRIPSIWGLMRDYCCPTKQ